MLSVWRIITKENTIQVFTQDIMCVLLNFFVCVSVSHELSQNAYIEANESVPQSVQTHDTSRLSNFQKGRTNRWKIAYYYLWKDFTAAYANTYVIKWSFWWALATCGFLQACALHCKKIYVKIFDTIYLCMVFHCKLCQLIHSFAQHY
jgi:hypothetical protein